MNARKIISTKDAAAQIEARRRDREAAVVFDPGRDVIVFPAGADYEISLRRIPSPEKLVGWIAHLSAKRWVTAGMLGAFAVRVAAIKGWRIHGL